jgi:hypothetical protein
VSDESFRSGMEPIVIVPSPRCDLNVTYLR